MSLVPAHLTNGTDTYVSQARPSENYGDSGRIRVRTGSPNEMFAYIYFARPFKLGAVITSATLHLTGVADAGGSRTLTVRPLLASWKEGQATYNARPQVDTAHAAPTVTAASGIEGAAYAFDVTALMQSVSNGQAWYGFRIETTLSTVTQSFYSTEAAVNKPWLDITWSDAPQAPTTLHPSGGGAVSVSQPLLSFDFSDHVGNTNLGAVQVQINSTNSFPSVATFNSTAPYFDSDWVPTSNAELDLSLTYPVATPITTTSGSTAITSAGLFTFSDQGDAISGTGIPSGAKIATVTSASAATLSVAATATGSPTATITEAFPALADGASFYWRVRVRDEAGVASAWSAPALVTRTTKGTLTITNPAASPSNFVTEATPPITWTFTGKTQTAWEVFVEDSIGRTVLRSGKVTSTATAYTIPATSPAAPNGILRDSQTYTVRVRVYDNVPRKTLPSDPPYVEAARAFTYNTSSSVAAITSLTGTDLAPIPQMKLTWTRGTAPDYFVVVRDDNDGLGRRPLPEAVKLLPSDCLVSGTTYSWTDRTVSPRTSHSWNVRAITTLNGVATTSTDYGTPVTASINPTGIWIQDPARNIAVQLLGSDSGSWTMGEDAEVYTPVGGTTSVRITQALRGFEGSISGLLVNNGYTSNGTPMTVAKAQADMYALKSTPGQEYVLTLSDMAIKVVIGNVVIAPTPDSEVQKLVSFDFWQTGNLPFSAVL